MEVGSEYPSSRRFAEKKFVFSETSGDLRNMIEELNREHFHEGLEMNVKRTKAMFNKY